MTAALVGSLGASRAGGSSGGATASQGPAHAA